MTNTESVNEYISRARGLAVKCASAGLNIFDRQLVYNVVRGLHSKFNQTCKILKTQREKKLDDILEILREKEKELQEKSGSNGQETAYTSKHSKGFQKKKCYVCGKLGRMAKDCWHRKEYKQDQEKSVYNKNKKDSNKVNSGKNANIACVKHVKLVNYRENLTEALYMIRVKKC